MLSTTTDRGEAEVGADRTILLVEDDPSHRALYARRLQQDGFRVIESESAEAALERFAPEVAAVVTDMRLPRMSGADLMDRLHQSRPDLPVIILTNAGTLEESLDLIDRGAFDYVQKTEGFRDFTLRVARAMKVGTLAAEVDRLRTELERRDAIVASASPRMLDVFRRVDAVAATSYPVLLLGESGTGKELVARRIHERSDRRDAAFLTVNCGAIPRELFESQLFGHCKGSFTGALKDQAGLFEDADGGTLFLDEVGEIDPDHQVKLLRALQAGEVQRLGETRPKKVDVRIVAATNLDLKQAVKDGAFREDLYYRLNGISISLPPLRERREDILPLVQHFLETAMAETGRRVEGFSPEALAALRAYGWPGNIRELLNKVRQSLIICQTERIQPEDLALDVEDADPSGDMMLQAPLAEARQMFERRYLERLLTRHDGNVSRAAEAAGKHRSELYAILRRHEIRPEDFRG
ncbi:MAG: sigma-54 dependent transcriptional regulator [Acidobacteriota bacterium]|jgi:two-component system response regulator GlrR